MKKSETRWRLDRLEIAMVKLLDFMHSSNTKKEQRKKLREITEKFHWLAPILLGWKE